MADNLNTEEALRQLTEQLSATTEAFKRMADDQRGNDDIRRTSFSAVKKGLTELGSTIMSTDNSMSKYSGVVNTVGKSVGSLAGSFGALGKAVEIGTLAFTKLAEAVLKQNDAILKSYDGLSKFGASLGTSTSDVLNMGLKAGYTSQSLESLYKNARSLGSSLTILGNTTGNGVKAFAQIAALSREQRESLRNLGFSQEEVTEIQSRYVKQIAETGGSLAKSPRQLQKETLAYIEQLTTLAALTGNDVEQQQKALELAQANENVNAFINDLELERAELLRQANKEQDQARKKSLQAEAERLDNQAKSTRIIAANIVATNDATSAIGKLESITNKSGMVLTENNAFLAMTGQNYEKINEMLRRGEDPLKVQMEMLKQNYEAVQNFRKQFGETAYALGPASKEFQKIFGISNKAREQALVYERFQKMTAEEQQKYLEQLQKDLDTAKSQGDAAKDLRNAQLESERELKQAFDELVRVTSGPVSIALRAVAKTVEVFGNVLNYWVDALKRMLPGLFSESSGSGGGQDDAARSAASSKTLLGRALKSLSPDMPGAGSEPTVTGKSSTEKPIAQVLETGSGFNVVEASDGTKQRREGTRAWRNNNPGNIEYGKFAISQGAIGSDGRFAIFPTKEIGDQARTALLFGKSYAGLSIADAISKYAPSGENDTLSYLKNVLSATGASPDTRVADLDQSQRKAMLAAMEKVEGFKQGKIVEARYGGILSGSNLGYPAMLHGTEMVIPLPDGYETPSKTSLPTELSSALGSNSNASSEVMVSMIETMTDKFNQMIDIMSSTKDIQESILTYSRV